MRSIRISSRSRAFDMTTEPSSTVKRSKVKAGVAPAGAPPFSGRAGTLPRRLTGWRSSGARSAGFTIATSVISGRPEKRLASESDTRTLSAVMLVAELLPSTRLILPSVTVGDGRKANFVPPSMRNR